MLVIARLGHGENNFLDLPVGVTALHFQQLRDRVVRDEHAVEFPPLHLLDADSVECINAKLRIEVVDVEVLEQRAGGHPDAAIGDGRRRDGRNSDGSNSDGSNSDGRRSDGSNSDGHGSTGRRDADAGRRSDGRRRRSDGRRRRRHISVEVALHQQRHHVLEVEEDVRAYVALPTYTCIVSANE